MKIRVTRAVLVALLAFGTIAVLPGVAGASAPPGELYECLVEAFETVTGEEAGALSAEAVAELSDSEKSDLDRKAQACYSSPSPVLPATAELFWGGLAFLVVLVVLMKFGFPAVQKALKARSDKIREDLESAESAKAAAEAEKAEYAAKIDEARVESTRLIDEARVTAEGVKAGIIASAEEEANGIRTRAAEDARAASNRALADLQSQVGSISVELAEKIVGRNIDAAAQQELIESFIAQVGKN